MPSKLNYSAILRTNNFFNENLTYNRIQSGFSGTLDLESLCKMGKFLHQRLGKIIGNLNVRWSLLILLNAEPHKSVSIQKEIKTLIKDVYGRKPQSYLTSEKRFASVELEKSAHKGCCLTKAQMHKIFHMVGETRRCLLNRHRKLITIE